MKIIYLILISILLMSCSSMVMTSNDIDKLDLNGKVKSLTYKEKGSVDTLDILKKVVKFNKKGNIKSEDYFKTDSTSIGRPSTKTMYTYTKFGKRKVKKQYKSDGRIYRKENYIYNSKKKLILKTRFDGKGNPLFVWQYTLNKKGERIGVLIKDVSYGGLSIDKSMFRYNKDGDLIERKNYDNNNVLHSIFSFEYNNNDLMKSESTFIVKNIATKSKSRYDKKGNAIESKSYDENNKLIATFITKYDSQNNKIKTVYTKNNLEVKTTYKYQYDWQKNWILKEKYINNVLKEVVRREIEYNTK